MAKSVKVGSTRQPIATSSAAPGESGTSLLPEESAVAGTGTQPAVPAGGGPTDLAGTGPIEAAAVSSDDLKSTNTPESDQNGGAGNSAGPADLGEQLGEKAPADVKAGQPSTGGDTSASGTNSEASQGDAAEGTGANAGPDFTLEDVLVAAGAENVAQLLNFADIGKRLDELFRRHSVDAREWLELAEVGTIMAPPIPRPSPVDDFEGAAERRHTGTVIVKSARDGFRRADLVLSKAGRTFGPGELTAKQVAALADDPTITVESL